MKVVIAILTWRGYEKTRSCLRSLSSLAEWPLSTVIIDNASGTGEGVGLAAEFGPPVTAIALPQNTGVAGGYNEAMRWAESQGASHVLLLNNDTVIEDRELLTLLKASAAEDVAVVGPTTLESDGSVFSVGATFDWVQGRGAVLPMPKDRKPHDVDWLDGCCLLVSLAAAKSVGGLALEYFMYWEEVDWCVRARRRNFRCVVVPDTSIRHDRATREPSEEVRYLLLRNSILFMRRNGSWRQNATSLAWTLLYRCPGMLVRRLLHPLDLIRTLRMITRAIAWNMTDAAAKRAWRLSSDGPPIVAPNLNGARGA
jgi:GT2 family glycosyltransferase